MSDAHLYAEVVALLGAETVEAAMRERGAAVEVYEPAILALSDYFASTQYLPLPERVARCAGLDERTRQFLARAILDGNFLRELAQALARLPR